jgi:pimeloyl-ACP methyl ester carboxylesterase
VSPGLPIVLLHGAWHGSWCWARVTAELAAVGRTATAVDMIGHGLDARWPSSGLARPFDPEEFAKERSPLSDLSLAAATAVLLSQLERIGGGQPCVLATHSVGGAVAARAAETVPGLFAHVVYISAFMPVDGRPAITYVTEPENADDLIPACLRADPATVGAFRLDPRSPDPSYHELLRTTFYNDLDPATADAAIGLLGCDAPLGLMTGASQLTAERWGSIPRTYVHCRRDNVVRPALQHRFVAEADAAFPSTPTSVVEVDASHSPFLSVPALLADVIAGATQAPEGRPSGSHGTPPVGGRRSPETPG